MTPRILAVRSALPDNRCLQAEFTDTFATRGQMSQSERVFLNRLHASAEVETRHTALPLADWRALACPELPDETFVPRAGDPGDPTALAAPISIPIAIPTTRKKPPVVTNIRNTIQSTRKRLPFAEEYADPMPVGFSI